MNSKDNPTISIIVPVYNAEKYLCRCLDSLKNQTYENVEVICVNDGSPDDSLRILNDYAKKDSRFVIIDKKNEGVSEARNTGMRATTGEYIMFVDSDDWLDLDTCQAAMDEMAKENADVVIWAYCREYPDATKPTQAYPERLVWDEDSIEKLRIRMVGMTGNELADPSKLDSLGTVWGKLFRRDVIKNLSFVDTKRIGTAEDVLFCISAFFHANKAVYIPNTFSHYFKGNEDSFTRTTYKKELPEKWRELYRLIEQELRANNASELFFDALNSRKAIGVMQLGLSLTADKHIGILAKRKELKRLLDMPHYKKAVKKLDVKCMGIHWKVFFTALKLRMTWMAISLLLVMDCLRRI